MYVEVVPNRTSPPAILLRESYREGATVKKRTLANLTDWPREKIEGLRLVLKGEAVVAATDAFEIQRSLPHGHVAAVLGTLHKLGLDRLLSRESSRYRELVIAMIAARVLDPRSKLATARGLAAETAASTLGSRLGIEDVDEDDLYAAMDWLLPSQDRIEAGLARRHLKDSTLALYDVTSTYFEGRKCSLAARGHSRDGRRDKLQIVIGLLCSSDGCPVAIEVFAGNTGDPKTLGAQVKKLKERFEVKRIVLVGDRGMLTEARIREDVKPEGLDWITALRAPAIKQLVEQRGIELSLFDEHDLAEITHPDYPGERLIVCKNPMLADERTRNREDLLRATEQQLKKVSEATTRTKRALKGKARIGLRVGKLIGRFKMAKHFKITIDDTSFRYERNQESITKEAQLDGIYVIRTSVEASVLDMSSTVAAYKGLSTVERAFRSLKTIDLKVRPIFHWMEERVRAHVFLCMLAYYVEWNMRRALAPLLFDDDDRATAHKMRASIVAPAERSPSAKRKDTTKRTDDGLPVHSFQTLLKDLATLTRNLVRYRVESAPSFEQLSSPTAVQQRAFDLLAVPIAV